MEPKKFKGKDLYELNPIVKRVNKEITKIYKEAGVETDPQTGEILNKEEVDISPNDLIEACLDLEELMIVVKVGVKNPDEINKMDWEEIYKICEEVMEKNADFFNRSLEARTMVLK